MAKVYLVTGGDYSDYGIYGVCSTEERAEGLIAAMRQSQNTDFNIEPWDIDEWANKIEAGMKIWDVQIERDGTVVSCEPEWDIANAGAEPEIVSPPDRAKIPPYRVPYLWGSVWAKDRAKAIAIVDKKRMALITSGEWKE